MPSPAWWVISSTETSTPDSAKSSRALATSRSRLRRASRRNVFVGSVRAVTYPVCQKRSPHSVSCIGVPGTGPRYRHDRRLLEIAPGVVAVAFPAMPPSEVLQGKGTPHRRRSLSWTVTEWSRRVLFELIKDGRRPAGRRPVLGSLSPSTADEECWRRAFARYLHLRLTGLKRDLER